MANNQYKIQLAFTANASQVQTQINNIRQSLLTIQTNANNPAMFGGMVSQMKTAVQSANQLQLHLNKAMNLKTGQLDLHKFNMSLKTSGQDLSVLSMNLLKSGQIGQQAFMQLGNSILYAQKPVRQMNTLLIKMGQTFANNARWLVSSYVLTGFTSSISKAYNYVKDLNKALTDIRIVTGYTKDEVDALAISANKMAKELKKSTLDVVKGQLIYQQQGDSMALSAKKAEITIKATATAAKASAEEMSNYLTAVWNSYKVGEENLQSFVDKANALGAKTAASQEEIFTAMEKSAAAANAVNVSYDQLGATIATISSVTRNSAETIGTTLKTVYARIGDLKVEGPDEDGIGLGQVSSGLKKLGIEVLDAQGELRDMGTVIEEIGNKYQYWTEAQQAAAVQLIAGKRQYTQMMALFENWSTYQNNLSISKSADGELDEQFNAYKESLEGALEGLGASAEKIYMDMFNDDAIIGLVNGLTKIVDTLGALIDGFGGLGNVIIMVSSLLINKFSFSIIQSFADLRFNIKAAAGDAAKSTSEVKSVFDQLESDSAFKHLNGDAQQYIKTMHQISDLQIQYMNNEKLLTAEQKQQYQNRLATIETLKAENDLLLQRKNRVMSSLGLSGDYLTVFEDAVGAQTNVFNARSKADNFAGQNYYQPGNKTGVVDPELIEAMSKDINQGGLADKKFRSDVYIGKDAQNNNVTFGQAAQQAKDFVKAVQDAGKAIGMTNEEAAELAQKLGTANADQLEEDLKKAGIYSDALKKDLMDIKNSSATGESIGSTLFGRNGKVTGKINARQGKVDTYVRNSNLNPQAVTNVSRINSVMDRNAELIENKTDDAKKGFEASPEPDAAQSWMKVGSAISMAASSVSMFKNAYDTLTSSDTSWGEKLISLFMTLGMLIPTITMVTDALNAKNREGLALGWQEIRMKMAKIGLWIAEKMHILTNIAAKKGLEVQDYALAAAEGAALWPLLLFVAALASLVAIGYIVVKIINGISNSWNADAIAAEKAAEKEKAAAERAKKTKETYDELKKSFEDYNTIQDTLDKLTEGTEEWRLKLFEANQQVLELLKLYPQLAEYIERDGQRLVITEEGQKLLLEKQLNAVSTTAAGATAATKYKIQAQQKADMTAVERAADEEGINWITGNEMRIFEEVIQEQGLSILGKEDELEKLLGDKGLIQDQIDIILKDEGNIFSDLGAKIEENSHYLQVLNKQYGTEILQNNKDYQKGSDLDKAAMESAASSYISGEAKIVVDGKEYTRDSYKQHLDKERWKYFKSNNSQDNQNAVKKYLEAVDPTSKYEIFDTGGGDFTIKKKTDKGWVFVNANLEEDSEAKNEINWSDFMGDYVNPFEADQAASKVENIEDITKEKKREAQTAYKKVFGDISGIDVNAQQANWLRQDGIFNFGELTKEQWEAVYKNILSMEESEEKSKYLDALLDTGWKVEKLGESSETAAEDALKAAKTFKKIAKDLTEEIFKEGRISFETAEDLRKSLTEQGLQNVGEYIDKFYEANLSSNPREALQQVQKETYAALINDRIISGKYNDMSDGQIIADLQQMGLSSESISSFYSVIKAMTKDLDEVMNSSEFQNIKGKLLQAEDFDDFTTGMEGVTAKYKLNEMELFKIYNKLRVMNSLPGFNYSTFEQGVQAGKRNGYVPTEELTQEVEKLSGDDRRLLRDSTMLYDRGGTPVKGNNWNYVRRMWREEFGGTINPGKDNTTNKDDVWITADGDIISSTAAYMAIASLHQQNAIKTMEGYKSLNIDQIRFEAQKDLEKEYNKTLDDQRLERLEEVIERISKQIEKIKKDIELIDWGLENADPRDYALQLDLYNKKIIKSGQYVSQLRNEYSRLKIEFNSAQTGDEAKAIADRMEEISEEIRSNQYTAVEAFGLAVQVQFQSVIDGINDTVTVLEGAQTFLDDFTSILEDRYRYGNAVMTSFRMSNAYLKNYLALQKGFIGESEAVKKKKEESKELIEEEERRNDEIYDIRMDALDKLHADAEKKRQEDLEKIKKNNDAIIQDLKDTAKEAGEIEIKPKSVTSDIMVGNGVFTDLKRGFDNNQEIANHQLYGKDNFATTSEVEQLATDFIGNNSKWFSSTSTPNFSDFLFVNYANRMKGSVQPYGKYANGKGAHYGVDLNDGTTNQVVKNDLTYGTYDKSHAIISFTDGTIVGFTTQKREENSAKGGYGNYIKIKDDRGYIHQYSHLPRNWDRMFGQSLSLGEKVSAGQFLSYAGTTGNSTGPHLHYSITDSHGKLINPSDYYNVSESFKNAYTYQSGRKSYGIGHNVGGPAAGLAFAGEEGRELVMWKDDTGQYHFSLIGQNGLELADFPKGSIVIPHEQTEAIINNPRLLSNEFAKDAYGKVSSEFNLGSYSNIIRGENLESLSEDEVKNLFASYINDDTKQHVLNAGQRSFINPAKDTVDSLKETLSVASLKIADTAMKYQNDPITAADEISKNILTGEFKDKYQKDRGALQERSFALTDYLSYLEKEGLTGSQQWLDAIDALTKVQEGIEKIDKTYQDITANPYNIAKAQRDSNIELAKSSQTVRKNLGQDDIFQNITAFNEEIIEAHDNSERAFEMFGGASKEYREALETETALISERKKELLNLAEILKDFSISKLEGVKNNLSKVQEITKDIRQKQHELNKELQKSLTTYQYLDAQTRKLLFNEEDYVKLSQKLSSIQEEVNRLSAEYLTKLEQETDPEQLEILNAEYQRKYELQMKSYTIAKQELEVEKKKAALTNTLNERNTQMFINGEWTWVADTDAIIKAQEELADAQYELNNAKFDLSDTKAMQTLEAKINKINGAFDDLKESITGKDGVEEALILMGKTAYNVYEEFSKITSYDKAEIYDKNKDYMALAESAIKAGNISLASTYLKKRNAKIDYEKLDIAKESVQDVKKRLGYAEGTSSAKSGLAQVIEKGSELLATKEGFLYEMSGGEMVFNNDQFRFLYEFSKTPVNKMLNGLTHNDNSSIDNSITINGFTVDSKSPEGEALKDILTRILGNR